MIVAALPGGGPWRASVPAHATMTQQNRQGPGEQGRSSQGTSSRGCSP